MLMLNQRGGLVVEVEVEVEVVEEVLLVLHALRK